MIENNLLKLEVYIILVRLVIPSNPVDSKILDQFPIDQKDLQAEISDVQASTYVDPPSFGNMSHSSISKSNHHYQVNIYINHESYGRKNVVIIQKYHSGIFRLLYVQDSVQNSSHVTSMFHKISSARALDRMANLPAWLIIAS